MFLRLCTLLLVLVAACASWAAFGAVGGTGVCLVLMAVAIRIWAGTFRWRRPIRTGAVLLWLPAVICMLLPGIIAARDIARCAQCSNNLKQIGLAVRDYWDVWECYPPASTYDDADRPMCSWRVLIYPFMYSTLTYDDWNFKEPWDGPTNSSLLRREHSVYKCPADSAWTPESTTTSYVAVVGRRAAWRRAERGKEPSNKDRGTRKDEANAFLVVEMPDSGIQWAEPEDIRFDDVQALRSLAVKSAHTRGNGYFFRRTPAVNAVLVAGDMVFMFPWDSAPGVLTGLLPPEETPTKTARPHLPDNPYHHLYTQERQVNWPHCIGLPVWIGAVGLLSYQVVRRRR